MKPAIFFFINKFFILGIFTIIYYADDVQFCVSYIIYLIIWNEGAYAVKLF